eukprot:CAMPEP_0170513622 /NCGR_PEP_ID=MMETSP0209-20121228/138_1 /TAXON_ID=665100 ORGANISM="Litonotus pictus, Strain P1" /NCGR_SAMPLE_ID=MMETSP0209 /ASSEMBLY_ACC=CAM_ASM_000301 /LENGTH=91 /DNA_ID=CAMNT_0010797377 /DNA_START=74 /DNA_END=345 /DNA_ORIENTATION=-
MNPGYEGRTALPKEILEEFSDKKVTTPEHQAIAEMLFYSEGLTEGEELSKSFFSLMEYFKESLSKQMQYDWGLRSYKAVARIAGNLIQCDS